MKFGKESFEYIKSEIKIAYDVINEGTPENFNFLAIEFGMNAVLREIEKAREASER